MFVQQPFCVLFVLMYDAELIVIVFKLKQFIHMEDYKKSTISLWSW